MNACIHFPEGCPHCNARGMGGPHDFLLMFWDKRNPVVIDCYSKKTAYTASDAAYQFMLRQQAQWQEAYIQVRFVEPLTEQNGHKLQ